MSPLYTLRHLLAGYPSRKKSTAWTSQRHVSALSSNAEPAANPPDGTLAGYRYGRRAKRTHEDDAAVGVAEAGVSKLVEQHPGGTPVVSAYEDFRSNKATF